MFDDIQIRCPNCSRDFLIDPTDIFTHSGRTENVVKSAKKKAGTPEAFRNTIRALLLKATDDRTPIHERMTACRVSETLMRKRKVALGMGLDKEILSFQYFRGFLKGLKHQSAPKLPPVSKEGNNGKRQGT